MSGYLQESPLRMYAQDLRNQDHELARLCMQGGGSVRMQIAGDVADDLQAVDVRLTPAVILRFAENSVS